MAATDFWPAHDPLADPIVAGFLDRGFSLTNEVRRADVVVASVFGREHWNARRHVAMFSGEAYFRDTFAGFTIDCRFLERSNHLRLPLWAYLALGVELDGVVPSTLATPGKFCNFIYSNPLGEARNAFFEKLHTRKTVDSLGSVMRNSVDSRLENRHDRDWRRSKQEVLRDYRFTIAFENTEFPGYTTEKLLDAWLAGSVPIYWGNPVLSIDFPEGSCLSAYEAGSLDRLVDQVLEAEHEPERYAQLQAANPFRTGVAQEVLHTYSMNVHAFAAVIAENVRRNPTGRIKGSGARVVAKSKWVLGIVSKGARRLRRRPRKT